jgi:hypothetical protein
MIREAGFRKAIRMERGVGRIIMYPIAPVAERLEKGNNMWGNGDSVRRRKSGEWLSNIVMKSTKKGLMAPTF